MSERKIEKLTPEQEALIPVYREKWRKIALSTEPINREKAAEAVKKAYTSTRNKEIEVFFYDSPGAAFRELSKKLYHQVCQSQLPDLDSIWLSLLYDDIEHQLNKELFKELNEQLFHKLDRQISQLTGSIGINLNFDFDVDSCSYPEYWANNSCLLDFCITVLNCKCDLQKWDILQLLAGNCGWIFPYAKICYICDRPRILSFDNEQRLHAEAAPAIQFADGYSLYAYHGVTLPEKYGHIHPNQWQTSWLLEEQNAELRRVLIQGIGYERIASELGATELDSFQEYSLLKIDNNVDVEPIYMLKMICPSTGYIHVLRLPPDLKSAREAIRWVNWGVDPEEFSMQT